MRSLQKKTYKRGLQHGGKEYLLTRLVVHLVQVEAGGAGALDLHTWRLAQKETQVEQPVTGLRGQGQTGRLGQGNRWRVMDGGCGARVEHHSVCAFKDYFLSTESALNY